MVQTLRSPRLPGKGLVHAMGELDEGMAGVAPQRHRRGARVVLLSCRGHGEIARADDAGDHADVLALVLQPGALLDVRLRVADVALGFTALDPSVLEACVPERIAQDIALRVDGIECVLPKLAAEGMAAEAAEEPALFVDPGSDIDRQIAGFGTLGQGPGHFQSVDDAHRPVEPAALGLGIGVRSDKQCVTGFGGTTEHRADAVDARFESRFAHPFAQPAARLQVDGSKRLADDAAPTGAECAQPVKIAQQALRVDPDLGWIHVSGAHV